MGLVRGAGRTAQRHVTGGAARSHRDGNNCACDAAWHMQGAEAHIHTGTWARQRAACGAAWHTWVVCACTPPWQAAMHVHTHIAISARAQSCDRAPIRGRDSVGSSSPTSQEQQPP